MFLQWHLTRGSDPQPLSPREQSAFELLADFAYEHNKKMVKFLPLILQNAFVVSAARGEDQENAQQSERRGDEERADRELLLNLMGGTGAPNAADTFAGDLVSRGSVRGHVSALSSLQPDIHTKWASMSFKWAVLSTDKTISQVSWRLFSFLNKDYSIETMHRVALCLHTAHCRQTSLALPFGPEYDAVGVIHSL